MRRPPWQGIAGRKRPGFCHQHRPRQGDARPSRQGSASESTRAWPVRGSGDDARHCAHREYGRCDSVSASAPAPLCGTHPCSSARIGPLVQALRPGRVGAEAAFGDDVPRGIQASHRRASCMVRSARAALALKIGLGVPRARARCPRLFHICFSAVPGDVVKPGCCAAQPALGSCLADSGFGRKRTPAKAKGGRRENRFGIFRDAGPLVAEGGEKKPSQPRKGDMNEQ